ncbi:MAG: glycoside hydrolase family 16 protein [Actinobacteria bacterium]|nr:glycoside hydrolase family 16 protein [Actinomycetota bacterium]
MRPEGVPPAQVGPLELDAHVSTGLARWPHGVAGEWFGQQCYGGGSYSISHGNFSLTTTGATGNCAEISSPATYTSGIFESRMSFSGSQGKIADWPVFWISGQPWPQYGEIDAAEGHNGCLEVTYNHEATPGQPVGNYSVKSVGHTCITTKPGWHKVAVAWGAHSLTFYYDGQKVVQWTASWIKNKPSRIILMANEGHWGLQPGTPASLVISYVRVWGIK